MKAKLRSTILFVGLSIFLIAFDQYTKLLVRQNLYVGELWMPLEWLAPYFRFTNWQNTGAAFGILQNANPVLKYLTSAIAVLIVFYYQRVPFEQKLERVSLTLMFAGAIGNVIDRFAQGFVTDFISVGSFAVFNVADSCVTIGVGLLVLATLIQENRDKKTRQAAIDEPCLDESGEVE